MTEAAKIEMVVGAITGLFTIVSIVFQIIGEWKLFKKIGKKGWLALIPFANDYTLGAYALSEKEAFFFMLFQTIRETISFLDSLIIDSGDAEDPFYLICVIGFIPLIVYEIRVFSALCTKFGKPKKWVFMWVVFTGITAMIWGINKNFMPVVTDEDKEEIAAELSGITTTGTQANLTINIIDRTASNFFKKKTLLRDIHMNIEPGHMVLLLGGSGAGKTTFLNAVTGYEKANATIELGSGDLYKDYKYMKYDVGFVPQQDLMRGSDTVYRTIADAAALRLPKTLSRAERNEKIEQTLDLFGLGMLKTSLVDKLSGGQRKRLSIAMEFISDPKLFILDEPDSGLDGIVARGLFQKLRDIADSGKIVIVITHTPDRVIDLFDDVIVLAKDADRTGRLTYFGPVNESLEFFGKDSMEGILRAINQKEEGGEGRADELVRKYTALVTAKTGGAEA